MALRRVPEVTAEQENFRLVSLVDGAHVYQSRRDPVEAVPVGTIVVCAFRVTGYDPDCDGSLMARLENVDADGKPTGWEETCIGLDPHTTWMVDDMVDLDQHGDQRP